MSQTIVRDSPDGALLTVHIQPKASRTEFAGIHGKALKFRVAAPPVGGAANEALCLYLAGQFGLPRGGVVLRAGMASRRKLVLLKGVPSRLAREVLQLSSTC